MWQIDKEVAVKMYMDMATLQVMDTIFYEAQRQGRISFYLTSIGEEAINIASAAALNFDDLVFPQVNTNLYKSVYLTCSAFHIYFFKENKICEYMHLFSNPLRSCMYA